MAVYEYICLACEHRFEQQRAMGAPTDVAVGCPSCGAGRVRRRFSVFATGSAGTTGPGASSPPTGGGCCGGGCACGN